MASIFDRIRSAWNVFRNEDEQQTSPYREYGASYGVRSDRTRLRLSNERSIIAGIYTRIAIDTASVDIKHARVDTNNRYLADIDSEMNKCLTVKANIDQGARAFKQDVILSLFDKGVVAIVPVDTSSDPNETGAYDIYSMRVGEIVTWYPRHVRISLYNDITGRREEVTLPKEAVAIVENPLYNVMNESNSTLQRLIRKLNLLDVIDEQSSSGRLDIIIQLPYVLKSEARKAEAEKRRKDIENQLSGSQYGIAYTDGTEKITQLNRPADNNMMKQIEYLTNMLYSQLGITESVLDGTADEKTMLNYYNRTVEPILAAITEAMKGSFLTKTARTQKQSIVFSRDPFKLVPISQIAEIADKFTRNEILTSNEVRGIIGFKPAEDPKADELRNKNLPLPESGGDIGELKVVPDSGSEARAFEQVMAIEQ